MKFNLKNRPSTEFHHIQRNVRDYAQKANGETFPIIIKRVHIDIVNDKLEEWFEGFEKELRELKSICQKDSENPAASSAEKEAMAQEIFLIDRILGEIS